MCPSGRNYCFADEQTAPLYNVGVVKAAEEMANALLIRGTVNGDSLETENFSWFIFPYNL